MNLQSKATTGNGTVQQIASLGNCHTVYITWSALVSAGGITLEEAPYEGYTGVWAALLAEISVGPNAGATVSVNIQHKPIAALRARISTTVVGGTVDVDVETS